MTKMIFILSDESDGTTDDFLDWLSHFGQPFLRLNGTSEITIKNIIINNGCIEGESLI
jgi:hypothetical protein